MVQEARLEPDASRGVALLQVEGEGLHEHRPVGELPAVRPPALRRFGEVDGVELDLRVARDGRVPLDPRAVGPLRGVHVVGDQARRGAQVAGRREQARLAQLAREARRARRRRGRGQAVDRAPHVVDQVELARGVLAEGGRAEVRVGDLPGPDDVPAVVSQRPDLAGVIVGVDVRADQFLQPRAPVDVAAGDGTGLGVAVLDDRRQDGGRPRLPAGPIRVAPLRDVPAVVAAAPDEVDHLAEVLADVAGPEVAGGAVEAEPPGLPQPVGPDLGPCPGEADERVVVRDRVGLAPFGVVDVDPEDRAREVAEVLPVVGPAAVAGRDVEAAVLAEGQAASVMPERRPFDHHALGRRIAARRVVAIHAEPGDAHLARPAFGGRRVLGGLVDVSQEEHAVLFEARVEGQPQDLLLQVEDQLGPGGAGSLGNE